MPQRLRRLTGAMRWLVVLAYVLALLPWSGTALAAGGDCVVSTVDDAIPPPSGSLREAVYNPACSKIVFALPGNGPWTINLVATLPLNDHDVAIYGPGPDFLALDGGNTMLPIFLDGVNATVWGLTIVHGHSFNTPGAGVRIFGGTVTLAHARVLSSQATGSGGGGLYVGGGTVTLDDVKVENNLADHDTNDGGGAGIYADQTYGSTALTIHDSTIHGNVAAGKGGGIFAVRWGGVASPKTLSVDITGGTIAENQTGSGGGGIYSWQAALSVTGAGIANNMISPAATNAYGGGIRLNGGTATIDSSTLTANSAGDKGGGLYASFATLVVQSSTIANNNAAAGGGIAASSGNLAIFNSTLSGNTSHNGGALIVSGQLASLTAVTIVENQADNAGGGILAANDGGNSTLVVLRQSLVAGNLAGSDASDCMKEDGNTSLTSLGGNVVGDGGGCPSDHAGDLAYAGGVFDLFDPNLADNGGPTLTHTLPPGSPVIDYVAVDDCAVHTDQRGSDRPQGIACDSGAVEAPVTPTFTVSLTISVVGDGVVHLTPSIPGTADGQFIFPMGSPVRFTAEGVNGRVFIGWLLDGSPLGWQNPLNLILDSNHTLQATFAAEKSFPDVPGNRADHDAIVALATRGLIRGYANGNYGPDDTVTRAQMAALIARATPSGGLGIPTLVPPACLVAGSWDCEDWGNHFIDQGGLDGNLWRDVGVLQHYGVANGLDGVHFGPGDPVTFAQTISFITRAMEAKGIWEAQPDAPLPYNGVSAAHADDVRTFTYYVYVGGIPAPPTDWNATATRGWFARALWAALDAPPLP
jgi:S-layer homology domain